MGVNSFKDIQKLNYSGEKDIKRGDIFYIMDTGYTTGSEQRAGRPAVVVSSDKGVKSSPNVSIVYLTTEPKPSMLVHADINSARKPSVALCEQVFTVSKNRIGDYEGAVTPGEMLDIERGIAEALGIRAGIEQEPGASMLETYENERLLKANEHIREVLKVGDQIGTLIAVINDIEKSDVRIGNMNIDKFITPGIKAEMKQRALEAIFATKDEFEQELDALISKAQPVQAVIPEIDIECIPPVEKPPRYVAKQEPVVERKTPSKSKLDIDTVRAMIDAGKTTKEIASEAGVTYNTAYVFIKNHGLNANRSYGKLSMDGEKKEEPKVEPSKRVLTEADIPTIKALYTNGPFNMHQLADEFRADVKEMHAFVKQHRLDKPVKNDMFRDANKMKKDEFRERMLADRVK